MIFERANLKKSRLYPVLFLEGHISEARRKQLIGIAQTLLIFFGFLVIVASLFDSAKQTPEVMRLLGFLKVKTFGLILLDLALIIIVSAWDAYFHSHHYFEYLIKNNYPADSLYTITVGRILYKAKDSDLLKWFLLSPVGKMVLAGCGVPERETKNHLSARHPVLSELQFSDQKVLKLKDMVVCLYDENNDFSRFLFDRGVTKEKLAQATGTVVERIEKEEMQKRWWMKENLDSVESIKVAGKLETRKSYV